VSTDAETIDDTTMGGSASQIEKRRPPEGRRGRRGGAIAAVAVVVASALGAFALVKAMRTPAATVVATSDARAMPDAPAPPPAPFDAPVIDALAIDAAPPPSPPSSPDARPKRRADAEPLPYEALPDEFDVVAGSKIDDRAVKRLQRCGAWTNEDGYAAEFRIGMDGEVKELELVGPDPEIKACMEKILRAGKYPMSKHGHDVSMSITR
jgi:hypothetical protein